MLPELVHLTPSELATFTWRRIQEAYEANQKIKFSHLIWRIAGWIEAGDITSTQARNSYNTFFNRSLTVAQWNTLVQTKFIPARDRYQAMLDEGAI